MRIRPSMAIHHFYDQPEQKFPGGLRRSSGDYTTHNLVVNVCAYRPCDAYARFWHLVLGTWYLGLEAVELVGPRERSGSSASRESRRRTGSSMYYIVHPGADPAIQYKGAFFRVHLSRGD